MKRRQTALGGGGRLGLICQFGARNGPIPTPLPLTSPAPSDLGPPIPLWGVFFWPIFPVFELHSAANNRSPVVCGCWVRAGSRSQWWKGGGGGRRTWTRRPRGPGGRGPGGPPAGGPGGGDSPIKSNPKSHPRLCVKRRWGGGGWFTRVNKKRKGGGVGRGCFNSTYLPNDVATSLLQALARVGVR